MIHEEKGDVIFYFGCMSLKRRVRFFTVENLTGGTWRWTSTFLICSPHSYKEVNLTNHPSMLCPPRSFTPLLMEMTETEGKQKKLDVPKPVLKLICYPLVPNRVSSWQQNQKATWPPTFTVGFVLDISHAANRCSFWPLPLGRVPFKG